jgi:hypothetical protein
MVHGDLPFVARTTASPWAILVAVAPRTHRASITDRSRFGHIRPAWTGSSAEDRQRRLDGIRPGQVGVWLVKEPRRHGRPAAAAGLPQQPGCARPATRRSRDGLPCRADRETLEPQ